MGWFWCTERGLGTTGSYLMDMDMDMDGTWQVSMKFVT